MRRTLYTDVVRAAVKWGCCRLFAVVQSHLVFPGLQVVMTLIPVMLAGSIAVVYLVSS